MAIYNWVEKIILGEEINISKKDEQKVNKLMKKLKKNMALEDFLKKKQ